MPKSTAAYLGCDGIVDEHEDVAGVHVGVEEVVPEHLREEDLHAVLGELAGCRCRLRAGAPCWRSARRGCAPCTMTPGRQKSQCTAGTYRRGEFSKLRRSCEALPASRIRSSSSRMVFSYSRTTSMGLRRRLPSQLASANARQLAQHFEVARDDGVHAGPQHLDHDFAGLRAVERALPGAIRRRAPARSTRPPAAFPRKPRTPVRQCGRTRLR